MNLDSQQRAIAELDLAEAALRSHLPQEAMACLRRALRLDPDSTRARILEARICLKLNQPREALRALDNHDHYAEPQEQSASVSMLRAQALASGGFDGMAIELLQKMSDRFKDDPRVHRMLGGLYLKTQKLYDAIESLREVVRLQPADDASGRLLAHLIEDDQPQSGIDLLIEQESQGDDPALTLRLARLCSKVGRQRDAAERYDRLLQRGDHDPGLWLESGQLADAMGESDLAIERLIQAANMRGEHRNQAAEALALTLMHAGRHVQAGRWWFVLAQRRPRFAKAWAGLQVCAMLAGRKRLAGAARRRLVHLTSRRRRRLLLGELWPHAVRFAASADADCSGKANASQQTSPLRALLEDAQRKLENATMNFPHRADGFYHRAMCENALGQTTAARVSVGQALKINERYAAAIALSQRLETSHRAAA